MLRSLRHRAAPASLLSVGLLWLAATSQALAELPWSRIDGVFPAGAKSGSTASVRLIGGSELTGVTGLRFSHPGLAGTRVAGSSPAENLFEVHVAADVPPGLYDVTAVGDLGLSNTRTFAVGDRDETVEVEPNETTPNATAASVPCVLNGRVGKATDIDAFAFHATAGQRIVADCLSARLDSPLLPVLEVLDARGRRVAFARSGRDGDAVLVFEPSQEGDYTLRVYDQTYRGGEDFVYRIALHSGPHVIGVQPVFGKAGSATPARVVGLNLPGAQPSDQKWGRWLLDLADSSIDIAATPFDYDRILPVAPREAAIDSFSWRYASAGAAAQPVRMSIGDAAPQLEAEPNQVREQAQRLVLPAEVSGDFRTVGDVDLFQFDVKKDEAVWIEAFADRLGTRADVSLTVEFLPEGMTEPQKVAAVDDAPTNLLPTGFETQSDDPVFRFVPPGNGTCLVQLRDQYGQTRGDATLGYRLVVRTPRPDFRLVAVPASKGTGMVAPNSVRRGDALEFTLLAFRLEGFDGAIDIPAADLGNGLICDGTVIPAGKTSAQLVIRSTLDAAARPQLIALAGQATLRSADGSTASAARPIRPAITTRSTTKVQGRNIAATARLARDWVLAPAAEEAPLELQALATRHKVAQGSFVDVPLKATRRSGAINAATIKARELPKAPNIEIADVSLEADETGKNARVVVRPDAPVQTVVFNWVATSKVQYRRISTQHAEARLALEAVTQKLKETNENAKAETPAAIEARVKELEAERLAAEKRFQELDQAKELDVEAVTSPLVLEVVAAPVAMNLAAGKDFTVPRGQSVSVPITLKRQNNYTGPVEISLAIPAMPAGVSGPTVSAAADVADVQLVIQAGPDAPEGALENASIKARCGEIEVAAPILLKVVP